MSGTGRRTASIARIAGAEDRFGPISHLELREDRRGMVADGLASTRIAAKTVARALTAVGLATTAITWKDDTLSGVSGAV